MCTVVADIAVHIVVHIAEHIDVYIGVHIDVHIDLHIGEQIAEHMGWSVHYNAFQIQLEVILILCACTLIHSIPSFFSKM